MTTAPHYHLTASGGRLPHGEKLAADAATAITSLRYLLGLVSVFNSASAADAATEQAEQCRPGGQALQALTERGTYSARVGARVYRVYRCEAADCDGEYLR